MQTTSIVTVQRDNFSIVVNYIRQNYQNNIGLTHSRKPVVLKAKPPGRPRNLENTVHRSLFRVSGTQNVTG